VVFVHGFTGDADAFGDEFVGPFLTNFISTFVDYGARSASGFDSIFGALPSTIEAELQRLRLGTHSITRRDAELGIALKTLKKRKIAATKVDVVAHSMGGLATRWFVTDKLTELSGGPRFVQYPSSSGVGEVFGTGFPPISTQRPEAERYRRASNFMHGNIRKIITTGSPQLGSPVANYVTHEIAGDDRGFYSGLLAQSIAGILQYVHWLPSGARSAADFGTAVYDLSQGSWANGLLQVWLSEPVSVHAIAAITPDAGTEFTALEALLRSAAALRLASDLGAPLSSAPLLVPLTPTVSKYCPLFDEVSSDIVVPLSSALYGTAHHSEVYGLNHLQVNTRKTIAIRISGRLLYDQTLSDEVLVNNFDGRFPTGSWPLNCGG
jgi:pimeloyl-ACP methyl ester carboxylesterase